MNESILICVINMSVAMILTVTSSLRAAKADKDKCPHYFQIINIIPFIGMAYAIMNVVSLINASTYTCGVNFFAWKLIDLFAMISIIRLVGISR